MNAREATILSKVIRVAEAFNDPARAAEASRYHKAIIDALNATHTNHEQDALAMFEALGRVLAQLTDGMADDQRMGSLQYALTRASMLRGQFRAAGVEAKHFLEPQGRA